MPDLGISTMEDVLADVRRIVEAKRGCLWSVDRQVGSYYLMTDGLATSISEP